MKAAVNIYGNTDPTMELLREFKEKAAQAGRPSVVKDAQKFVEELRLDLKLQHPTRSNRSRSGRREDRNTEVWRMDQERGAKAQESVANVLPGCSALAQTKYLYRHNAALKILHFELLRVCP